METGESISESTIAAERRNALAAKREREADMMRKRRKRLAAGAIPKELSAERLRPWEAEGISRATWYNRGNRAKEWARARMKQT